MKWADAHDFLRRKLDNILVWCDMKSFLEQVEPPKDNLLTEIYCMFLESKLEEYWSEKEQNIDVIEKHKKLKEWLLEII